MSGGRDAPRRGRASRAPRRPPYSFGSFAAAVAPLVAGRKTVAVGHSMGGVVALALVSGWFGVEVTACVGLGIKVSWTAEELAGAAALADRPPRTFATRAEAVARYLRVSGLEGLVDPEASDAAEGVAEGDDGWQLAHDSATFTVGAPDMAGLLGAARAPVLLGAGEHDAMSPAADLRSLRKDALVLPGLGHNAHVEHPEAVWSVIIKATGRA